MPELLSLSDDRINVAIEVGSKYSQFGIFLLGDTNGNILETLEIEHLKNSDRINMAILQRWLQGKGVKPVTWSTLITVLKKIDM